MEAGRACEKTRIGGGELHLWQEDLDKEAQESESLLCQEELQRAGCFRFSRDAQRFKAGRAFLRRVLSGYAGADPADLQFCYGPFGKPGLKGQQGPGAIRFNLSHSREHCLLAVTRGREVGCDLEKIRNDPFLLDMTFQFFSPGEKNWLGQLPAERRAKGFFQCWTLKESYLKGRGEGLMADLDKFTLIPRPDGTACLESANEARRWTCRHFMINQDLQAAVAVEGEGDL